MWYGWIYATDEWQRVCEAPTMDGASALLSQMYPTLPTIRQCISQGLDAPLEAPHMTRIHPNALRILLLIQARRDRGLPPPSYREIAQALGLTFNAVAGHLERTRRRGLVTWDRNHEGGVAFRTLRANYRLELIG